MNNSTLAALLGADLLFLLILVLIILLILWLLLPFAVFGIKKRLDLMLDELRMIKISLNSVRQNSVPQQSLPGEQQPASFWESDRNECADEIMKGLRYRYLPEYIRSKLKKDHNYPDSLIIEVTNKLQQEGKLTHEKAKAISATDK